MWVRKKAFIATTQYFLGPELKVVVKFEAEIRTPKVSTEADFEAIFSLSVFKRPKITLTSNWLLTPTRNFFRWKRRFVPTHRFFCQIVFPENFVLNLKSTQNSVRSLRHDNDFSSFLSFNSSWLFPAFKALMITVHCNYVLEILKHSLFANIPDLRLSKHLNIL